MAGERETRKQRSKRRRAELRRQTGFAGDFAAISHEITEVLRAKGMSASTAWYAGQLVVHGGRFSFEGNTKIAEWGHFSVRTAQRARKLLEEARLIESFLILPGQRVEGQRYPVTRPQVVRDVTGLLALIPPHLLERLKGERGKKPVGGSAVGAPPRRKAAAPNLRPVVNVAATPVAPETFQKLATAHPQFASYLAIMAEAAANKPPPRKREKTKEPPAPPPDPAELDELDAELERTQRGLEPKPPP